MRSLSLLIAHSLLCPAAGAQSPRNGRPDPNQEPSRPAAPVVGEARPVEIQGGDPCLQEKQLQEISLTVVVITDPPGKNYRQRPVFLNFNFDSCAALFDSYRGTHINVRALRRYAGQGSASDYEFVITTHRGTGHSALDIFQALPDGSKTNVGSFSTVPTSSLLDPTPIALGEVFIGDYNGTFKSRWKDGYNGVMGAGTLRVMLPLKEDSR